MSTIMRDHLEATHFTDYQALRGELMTVLTDRDLSFRLGGSTMTLGALCREMGDVERAYVDSFRTFEQDFEYHHPDPRMETSVESLTAWYTELDEELAHALGALSDEDVLTRPICRSDFDPSEWAPLAREHLDNYREALLIFYGKASVYLRAMERPFPGHWSDWIA